MNMSRIRFVSFLPWLPIVLLLYGRAMAERTIPVETLYDKLRGMWLGQLIGNAAGRLTEGKYSSTPNPDDSVPWVIKLEWDADDDTDIEYLALHILETNGFDCNSHQITEQWRSHITASGIYIANRQAWYLMGDGYIPPETGSQTYNEHWYSIDSQITTEILGAVSPGLARTAVDLSGRFAHVTNTGLAVHAAQFYAAMYANAFFEPNIVTLVTCGLSAIPLTSRTHHVAADVLNWYLEDINDGAGDWRATRYRLYDKYQGANSYGRYYNWLESTVNTGATVLAILYGQGDFKRTIQIGVLAGWDCDCNPATAGGLIGTIDGFSNLPSDLTDPGLCGDVYKNVYRPYLPDPNQYRPQYDTITGIASRLTLLAEQNILNNGGYITGAGPSTTCHLPDDGAVVPEPEVPDPNGPAGLVADALKAGIAVTPTAAVQRYDPGKDREDLYSIIDGIKDNSYNGHKPYYSYISDANARPDRDWYQLGFSPPVKFDRVTFYEGDVVWYGINNYYRTDNAKGGFFNHLTVEILRDGRFIEPANLQMAPALDRFKMYQTITFSFAPTVGDAIRIIGAPGGADAFTTILELEIAGDIDPGFYIESVRIADGQAQRSNLNKVEIRFSRNASVTKGDVRLIGAVAGTVDMNEAAFDYDDAARRLTLLFQSPLPDDAYSLELDCDAIADANALPLLDDDRNPDDGFYTIKFHRLFGDADGSAAVDLTDLAILALHWSDGPGDTGLDSNDDNILNFSDLAALVQNWLSVSFRTFQAANFNEL